MKLVDKQNIFNSGILSSKLYSRDDLKQYTNGIAEANNFICSRYGPMEKRVGTEFIYDMANVNEPIFFIPFIFSIDEALLLEFRPYQMRVYAFDKADRTRFRPIADPENPEIPYIYETILGADKIENMSYVQSLDVLYLAFADGKTPPHKLSRLNKNNTQWNLEEFETEDGPYLNQNYNISKTMKINDVNTDISVVTMKNFSLSALDEGRWIRICTPRYNENTYNYEDKWSYGKIKEVGNSTWLVEDSTIYTDTATPRVKTSKKAGTSTYRNTQLTSSVGQVIGADANYEYIVVNYKKYYAQGTIAEGKYRWQRKNTSVFLDVTIKDGKAYKDDIEVPIDSVQLYSDAEYTTVVGYLVSITNNSTLTVQLQDLTDEIKGRETIQAIGSTITVEWKYRNFVDEEDQDWMKQETSEWRLGVWHAQTNNEDYPVTYPTKVTIHQQRLVWAGMTDRPWVWSSNSFAYQNYAPSDFEGEIKDTNSIVCDISTDKISEIFWLKSVKSLLIGTELGELRMYSAGTAITPADVVTMRESSYGSHNCEPVVNDDNIVFVQRLQRTLRSLSYDYNQDSFVGPELTILAENLTVGGIKKIVFQKEPNNTYWCLKEDGTLLTLTYDKSQDVIGWSKCTIAGTNAKVIDLAVLPSKVNQQDMLILAVERTINGERKRYLELLTRNFTLDVSQEDGVFLDCSNHVIYNEPVTIVGEGRNENDYLTHLEGETVRVTSDGAIEGDYVVTNGKIELDNPCTNIQVGLPYDAYFETLERDYQDKQVSTKLSKLRVYKLRMYIERSLGIKLNRLDRGSETRLITFDPSKNTDEAPALVTGKVTIDVASAWDCDYRLKVVSEPGLPCTVSGITIGLELNEL